VAVYVAICRWGEVEAVVTGCGATRQAEKSAIRPPKMTMIVFQRIAITVLLCLLPTPGCDKAQSVPR
jgi:hypothetical protein